MRDGQGDHQADAKDADDTEEDGHQHRYLDQQQQQDGATAGPNHAAPAAADAEDEEEDAAEVEVGYTMQTQPGTVLLVRQQRSRGLSFQLWPAAPALCSYLETLHAQGELPRGGAALELGAGTGLVGMAAAALLGARVLLTDLPHVLPNLAHNAALNRRQVERAGGALAVRPLRWGERKDVQALLLEEDKPAENAAQSPAAGGGFGGGFDLILASDVVYYDTLYQPLLATLRWLAGAAAGGEDGDGKVELPPPETAAASREHAGPGPLILLAHLRRWKKDSRFFKMAAKHFHVQVVHRHPAPPGARMGVLVYSLTRKCPLSTGTHTPTSI